MGLTLSELKNPYATSLTKTRKRKMTPNSRKSTEKIVNAIGLARSSVPKSKTLKSLKKSMKDRLIYKFKIALIL